MRVDETDMYQGFEGEPEIVIEYRVNGTVRKRLRSWEGYLDQLMDAYSSPAEGWFGFALPYHLLEGWNSEPEWVDVDPAATLRIIEQATMAIDDRKVLAFANALAEFSRAALTRGGSVVWMRE